MSTARVLPILVAPFALAACGSADSGSAASVAAGGPGAAWALDACKTFPIAAAAKASGLAIVKAELVNQTSAGGTDVSNCSYATAGDADHFGILLRQDTGGTSTMKDQLDSLTGHPDLTGPSEIVDMPKGKAVWQPQLRTLSYVPDDSRLIVVTPPGIELSRRGADPARLKAGAITIAKAIEG